jgi:sec-independent protein translocase protein TatA
MLFRDFGAPELIIILVIVLLLFGPGRIGKIAGELGKGIRSFRDGISGEEKKAEQDKKAEEEKRDES